VILRVGLTGGIASGKSTILRFLHDLGCVTVDADSIVSRLYEPGNAGHDALVRHYGEAVLDASGRIDRARVAAIAFSSPEGASALNSLIHPLVIAEERRMLQAAEEKDEDAIYVVEATLLLESGGRERYDRVVVVDVDPSVQLDRAAGRGMNREDARRRMANQMSRMERLRQADYVIDNSRGIGDARRETERVFHLLVRDLENRKNAPAAGERPT
jgi:dephospho-CoA kinase